jgi:putative FmdB family regulatory protein
LPTYDYQCRSCGRVFEVIHPMAEDGPSTCEVCGGELRRIFHPTGIIFKGSGFYKTDSRSSGSASVPAKGKASAPAGDAAGTSTGSEGGSGGGSGGAPTKETKPSSGSSGEAGSASD